MIRKTRKEVDFMFKNNKSFVYKYAIAFGLVSLMAVSGCGGKKPVAE